MSGKIDYGEALRSRHVCTSGGEHKVNFIERATVEKHGHLLIQGTGWVMDQPKLVGTMNGLSYESMRRHLWDYFKDLLLNREMIVVQEAIEAVDSTKTPEPLDFPDRPLGSGASPDLVVCASEPSGCIWDHTEFSEDGFDCWYPQMAALSTFYGLPVDRAVTSVEDYLKVREFMIDADLRESSRPVKPAPSGPLTLLRNFSSEFTKAELEQVVGAMPDYNDLASKSPAGLVIVVDKSMRRIIDDSGSTMKLCVHEDCPRRVRKHPCCCYLCEKTGSAKHTGSCDSVQRNGRLFDTTRMCQTEGCVALVEEGRTHCGAWCQNRGAYPASWRGKRHKVHCAALCNNPCALGGDAAYLMCNADGSFGKVPAGGGKLVMVDGSWRGGSSDVVAEMRELRLGIGDVGCPRSLPVKDYIILAPGTILPGITAFGPIDANMLSTAAAKSSLNGFMGQSEYKSSFLALWVYAEMAGGGTRCLWQFVDKASRQSRAREEHGPPGGKAEPDDEGRPFTTMLREYLEETLCFGDYSLPQVGGFLAYVGANKTECGAVVFTYVMRGELATNYLATRGVRQRYIGGLVERYSERLLQAVPVARLRDKSAGERPALSMTGYPPEPAPAADPGGGLARGLAERFKHLEELD